MKKHVWIKILSLAIALLMVSATLVACFGGDSVETDGNTNQDETVSTDDGGSNNSAFEISGLPERDYEGEAFVIRYATKTTFVPNTLNVQSHEAKKDIVKQAGYDRDKRFEELTGTEISYVISATNPNAFSGADSEIASIRSLHEAGDIADIDMMCIGARTCGIMITEGLLTDLYQYDNYIKPDSYYYSTGLNKHLTMGGKLFAASGYYTTHNVAWTDAIAVNNDILAAIYQNDDEIENIYELVFSKEWTMEKMFEYGANYASGPINGDLDQDTYTFICDVNGSQALFHALGGTMVEKDKSDLPVVTITNQRNVDILDYLNKKLAQNYACYLAEDNTMNEAFSHRNSLFMQCVLSGATTLDEGIGVNGRLLPMPLYEAGNDYIGNCEPWKTNFAGIPAIASDPDMAAYCFEAFMALSYDFVYPEFYEKLFKTRYSEDENEAKLFDLIAESSYMDYVNAYQWQSTNTVIRNMITKQSADIGSSTRTAYEEIDGNIKKFLEQYNLG